MAKIHRISGYVVDIEGDWTKYKFVTVLKNLCFLPRHIHFETVDIGEWEKKNPLNHRNCDLSECEKWFPKKSTKGLNKRKVKVGAIYRHFKGHEVKVLAIAQDTEFTNSYSVIYEHLGDGRVWSRPYDMFVSEVDHAKYPNVTQKYRFEEVEELGKKNDKKSF